MADMAAVVDFQTDQMWLFFLSTSCIDTSYKVSSQLAFLFRGRRAKTIFKTAILDPIGLILAICNMQVTPILPIKFYVNLFFRFRRKNAK